MTLLFTIVFWFIALLSGIGMLFSFGNPDAFFGCLQAFTGSAIVLLLCEIAERLPKQPAGEREESHSDL